MVQKPGISLRLQPAPAWSAEGPLAERALAVARSVGEVLPAGTVLPHHIVIQHAAPEHMGLGTGTQLALAIAAALARSSGLTDIKVTDLALPIGRGNRSSVGIHGFLQGGFLVAGGKRDADSVAPLVARAEFPAQWRIVLVLAPWKPGLSGE